MILKQVTDKATREDFLNVARFIYHNDKNWVCPLDAEVEAVFDPQKNSFHQHGKITRWVLYDANKAIGRIAAFINHKKADKEGLKVGGVGFFECIDDQAAANQLFDVSASWLKDNGMSAMDGPINFGENDSNWGLLIEGFIPPSFGMNYNPPYYLQLFKTYGFEAHYTQITNKLSVYKEFPERFTKIAKWVTQKPGYEFRHLKIKELHRFAIDFQEIYNDAWQDFEGFTPITTEAILNSFRQMKPIADERLIWFSYINGEPVSVLVILPDANQMIKNINGKLNLLGKLKFAYNRWKGVTNMRAVVMGTKKQFQNHGLESAMFIKVKEYVLPLKQYKELELSWVGDFNEKMLALHKAMGAEPSKRHLTMRKIFSTR